MDFARVDDGGFVGEAVNGVSGRGVIDENIIIAVVDRLGRTLIVAKTVLGVLSRALVVFGVESTAKTRFVYGISAVREIVLIAIVDHVLLVLSILDRDRLLVSLLRGSIVWVDVVLGLLDIRLNVVSSGHRPSA